MTWIIYGLAVIGGLSLILLTLLILLPSPAPKRQPPPDAWTAWQRALASKQAHDLAAFQAAVAITLASQAATHRHANPPTSNHNSDR